ncbi:hypothetical protein ACEWPL_014555 [Roseovarius sp. S1116L3]|uniref:hypothetical protein n=1 Tax=Roseovarius roseus TaxID=3342636 RepID=UPI00372B38F9
MLHFTGSKAHNIALSRRATGNGWKLNEYGLCDRDDRIVGQAGRGWLEAGDVLNTRPLDAMLEMIKR